MLSNCPGFKKKVKRASRDRERGRERVQKQTY
jgi:hypothetical protein